MSKSSQVEVSNGTGIFKLVKDMNNYNTYWVCLSGRCPGSLGHSTSGMIVPIMYNSDLYRIARESGYSDEDLAAPKRLEKVKASGRTRSVVTKKSGIKVSLRDRMIARMRAKSQKITE